MSESKPSRLTWIILILVLALIASLLCSCSSNGAPQNGGSSAAGNSEVYSSESSSSSAESSALPADDLSIEYARDFADGVAWVSESCGSRGTYFDYLIDVDGNILIDCEAVFDDRLDSSDISNYCADSAVLEIEADKSQSVEADYQIIDKSGNVIWSMLKDGRNYATERYGKDAFAFIRVDNEFSANGNHLSSYDYRGYLVVYIGVDTYDFTGTLSGVLDSKGNWLIEPSPLSDAKEVASWQYHTYIMCNGSNLINYRTGEILPLTDKGAALNPYAFEFGGREAGDIDLWDEYTIAHNGVRYKSRMIGETGASGFLDANENKVLDIASLFPNASVLDEGIGGNIEFNDGYCLLALSNDGGGKYLTAIDLEGNQLFDPIKNSDHGALYEGVFFYQGNADGSGYYLTAQGERLGTVSADEGGDFHDGRAWIVNDGVYSCIDISGEIVF